MAFDKSFAKSVILAVNEIFKQHEIPLNCLSAGEKPLPETGSQITVMLTFQGEISGVMCFKCNIDFGTYLSEILFGDKGIENDYQIMKEALQELLNWFSGGIKKYYNKDDVFTISIPSVLVIESPPPFPPTEDTMTQIVFESEGHIFHFDVALD